MSDNNLTFPMQASALRKGGHVILQGQPCRITDMSTSKTGKHGHAKVHFVGVNIFTNKKIDDIQSSTHNMDVPNVTRTEYLLQYIDDGFLSLMDEKGELKEDIKLPDCELGDEIETALENNNDRDILITIQSAMGEEAAISFKLAKQN